MRLVRLLASLMPSSWRSAPLTLSEERQLRFRSVPRYRVTQPANLQKLRLRSVILLKRVS